MNMRLLITLTLVLLAGCYRPISGTVVDADTNAPIEGAVVLVEWTKTHGIGNYSTESYKVAETVTDKDGKFTLPGCYSPFVNEPNVTIYKKGYVAWSSRWIFPDRRNRTDYKWRNEYTFRLAHFDNAYSYDEHTVFISLSINSPLGSNKDLMKKAYRWEELQASKELDEKYRKKKELSQ
jgi:hypothetical protein